MQESMINFPNTVSKLWISFTNIFCKPLNDFKMGLRYTTTIKVLCQYISIALGVMNNTQTKVPIWRKLCIVFNCFIDMIIHGE